jgi:hypothetical protein
MTISVAITNSANEILDSLPVAESLERFHLEPRCRVCRNDDMRRKVNNLLALGRSYAAIVRAIEADNAALGACDRVTIDSVRNHTSRHFPVQDAAKATYRQILERRAEQNGIDFVNGLTTALTPMAFFEIVMLKAFESLIDPDATVDVAAGMIAAGRLQALLPVRDGESDLARLKAQVVQIGGPYGRRCRKRCGDRSSPSSTSLSRARVISPRAMISTRVANRMTSTRSDVAACGQ